MKIQNIEKFGAHFQQRNLDFLLKMLLDRSKEDPKGKI